jgi:hypothetical protein
MMALRQLALRYPEAEEGIACAGTALETCTVKVRNKAFLFVGTTAARLKLSDSLAEAERLAAQEAIRYEVGANGWVKVTYADGDSLPLDVLARWIDESYRLLAPKQLLAQLPEHGQLPGSREKASKPKTPKKNAKPKRPSR